MKNQNLSGQTQLVLDLIYANGVEISQVRNFVAETVDDYNPVRIALILTGKITKPEVNTCSEKFNGSVLKSYDFYRDRVEFSYLKKRTRYFEKEEDSVAFRQCTFGTDEYKELLEKSTSWQSSQKTFHAENFVEENSYCTLEEWQ